MSLQRTPSSSFSSINIPTSPSFPALHRQTTKTTTMSTDLELLHDSCEIRRLTVKTRATEQASKDAADDIGGDVVAEPQKNEEDNNNDNSECRTPTSAEHRIPKILDCPPAPRKARRAPSCKRKLSELQFFEIVNPEEVDEFFRSSSEKLSTVPSAKRSCCPCK